MAQEEKESRLVRVLDVFGNIFALNVLFVICSIPVITIGASTAALYSVTLKLVKKEEGPIIKSYFKAFKSNFKAATITWVLVLIAVIVIFVEYLFGCNVESSLGTFYLILSIVEAVLLAFTLPFLFPLIARYDNTIFNTIKNAFLLSVSSFGSWLKIFLAWFAPVFLSVWNPEIFLLTWYLWLFLIIGIISYGTSFTIHKVFKRIEDKSVEDKVVEDKAD